MKKLTKFLIALAVVVAALLFGHNLIIKKLVEKGLQTARGFHADVGSIEVGIVRPVIRIRNMTVTNPSDFPRKECLTIKEVYVRYDPFSLFSNRIHFPEIVLDVPKAVIVWKNDGELNFDRMAEGEKKEEDKKASEKKESPKKEQGTNKVEKVQRTLLIDTLTLRVAEAQVYDYRKGKEPSVMTLPIKLDRTYKAVDNPASLAAKLAVEVASRYIASLIDSVGEKMKKNGDTDKINKAFQDLGKTMQGLFRKNQ